MRRERLTERRKSVGISQAELAAKVGTTVTTISRIETGAQDDVGGGLMLAIAKALGLDTEAIEGLFEPAAEPVAETAEANGAAT